MILTQTELFREIYEQLKTAVPALLGFLLYRVPWMISLRFIGGVGSTELAAASFANSICNITGMALSAGLNSALTTLTSQARGMLRLGQKNVVEKPPSEIELAGLLEEAEVMVESSDKFELTSTSFVSIPSIKEQELLLPLIYLYRGLFVQFLFILPICAWWIAGVKPLLLYIGHDEKLSEMTEEYLRLLAPGLVSYSVNWTIICWLQAIGMSDLQAYAASFGLILHIPTNYFFMYTLGWGYLGSAMATSLFQLIQPIQMIVYVFFTNHGRQRTLDSMGAAAVDRESLAFWNEAKAAVFSLSGLIQYLSLAVPGIVAMSEWWASEFCIVLSGNLKPFPELALGAMTLFQSLNSFFFMFPVAFSTAGSMRVGNLLGANDGKGAAFAGHVNILCASIVSGLLSVVLFTVPHSFLPSLFAPNAKDLIHETSRTIPLLSIYIFGDSLQCVLNGIIKGCGRQFVSMPVVVFSYWVIGVPLAYYLAFIKNGGDMTDCEDNYFFCGHLGLIFGTTIGTWLHMFSFAVVVLCYTNWDDEATKARDRVGKS